MTATQPGVVRSNTTFQPMVERARIALEFMTAADGDLATTPKDERDNAYEAFPGDTSPPTTLTEKQNDPAIIHVGHGEVLATSRRPQFHRSRDGSSYDPSPVRAQTGSTSGIDQRSERCR